jgi:hypothetical protein
VVVWKFPIPIADEFSLDMPAGARLLTVAVQGRVPCLWALVDPEATRVPREFRLVGTGHRIDSPAWLVARLEYAGTFQMADGALVFHLFARSGR